MNKKYYITTPIYYVNAKPHIGSAYTTIAADVLARWHKQKGEAVHFLTGTAEHGSKIATSAAAANQEPPAFTDRNVQYFQQAWHALNLQYDDFLRTTEPRHAAAVALFFQKLKASGQLYEANYAGLYCVGHEAFIKETDLDEHGHCPDHGQPPDNIKERNWFFKLSAYAPYLRKIIADGTMQVEPPARRNEVLSFIDQGLEDIAVSRQTAKFALPLPWDNRQTIYVWLDELFNYCSAIGYGRDEKQFNHWWPADLHLVGKDIIKFHCVIWPALLKAIGEKPPRRVFAHGFFTVNGQKISKTLGNAIDPVELVKTYGADAIRYFLLRDIPFGNDGDFSHQRLQDRYNSDLANGLGNLVSRVLNMIERYAPDSTLSVYSHPPAAEKGTTENKQLPEEIKTILASVDVHMTRLAFDQALAVIWQVITWADELIETTKPWQLAQRAGLTADVRDNTPAAKKARAQLTHVLTTLFFVLTAINQKIAPFLPDTHDQLTRLLDSRPITKPARPLFARKN